MTVSWPKSDAVIAVKDELVNELTDKLREDFGGIRPPEKTLRLQLWNEAEEYARDFVRRVRESASLWK